MVRITTPLSLPPLPSPAIYQPKKKEDNLLVCVLFDEHCNKMTCLERKINDT